MEIEENASDLAFPLTNKSWQIPILSPETETCRIMGKLPCFSRIVVRKDRSMRDIWSVNLISLKAELALNAFNVEYIKFM